VAGRSYRLFTSNTTFSLPCFPNLQRSKERAGRH